MSVNAVLQNAGQKALAFGKQLCKTLGLVFSSSPRLSLALTGLLIIQSILPLGVLWVSKKIIDRVSEIIMAGSTNAGLESVWGLVLIAAGLSFLILVCNSLNSLLQEQHATIVQERINNLLHEKSLEVDLAYYENPSFHDTLHHVQQSGAYRPTMMVNHLFATVQSGFTFTGLMVLLIGFHWSMPLWTVLTILPSFILRLRFADERYEWTSRRSSMERKSLYYHHLISFPQFAKEIRLLGTGRLFRRRYQSLRSRLRIESFQMRLKHTRATLATQLLATLVAFGFYLILIYRTILGFVTLGGLVMYFQAFQQALNHLKNLAHGVGDVYEDSRYISQLYAFLGLEPQIKRPARVRTVPDPISQGIVFDRVSFHYPYSERWVLQEVSFEIGPGERLALAGANGSGKTTLIKLLCRLYDPPKGRILVDGIDIREFDPREWWRCIAVMFQDYLQYYLSARENIWFGDIQSPQNRRRIEYIGEAAGIHRVLDGLPFEYNTLLGKWFDDGEELSTGEWQKLAMARAFFRDAPIMIFDEPTSSLDARHERTVLKAWLERTQGRIALLISHRLSTLQVADRIMVLKQGRIVEIGVHEQLLQQGGVYQELFDASVRHAVEE
jgi:ATP-binding cassette subfamily B protein